MFCVAGLDVLGDFGEIGLRMVFDYKLLMYTVCDIMCIKGAILLKQSRGNLAPKLVYFELEKELLNLSEMAPSLPAHNVRIFLLPFVYNKHRYLIHMLYSIIPRNTIVIQCKVCNVC